MKTLILKSCSFMGFALLIAACSDAPYQPTALALEQEQAPSIALHPRDKFPEKLSDWQLFYINNGQFNLSDKAVPYHLNTPLFTDYAHKFRSIWIPDNSQITIESTGHLAFPVGTILSKTFYYPREDFQQNILAAKQLDKAHSSGRSVDLAENHLLETRLLVKHQDGWQALPYIWNADQTEAILEITGGQQQINLQGANNQSFTYMVPDANQCKGCHVRDHSSSQIMPIGPKVQQLDLDYSYTDKLKQNQLSYLIEKGLVDENSLAQQSFSASHNWQHRSDNIENAARTYLDINCGHCHNPDGPADTSALYLNRENQLSAHLGICKPPVAAGKGTGNRAFDIHPGKADESIIVYRMESNDPSVAMPELGRSIIHEEGVELIKQWINGLEGSCETPKS